MNKILILAEKKYFEEIFRGLYEPNGFQVAAFSSNEEIRIAGDDHFIVVRPGLRAAPLAKAIEQVRTQVSDLKVICISKRSSSSFQRQFDPSDIDVYFSDQTSLGEIKEAVRHLMFRGRLQVPRTEAVTAPA